MLSFSLALGALTACNAGNDDKDDDDDETTASRTDTQLIKNGDFEFYGEMDKELDEKRSFISSPNSWSFTSGSPSSNTTSGIINTEQKEWDSYTKSTKRLVPEEGTPDEDKPSDAKAISNAIDNWSEASVYDRLQFLDYYSDALKDLSASSTEKKFFNDYNYSIDFEDVEKLREELGDTVKTRYADTDEAKSENTGVLMIHNQRTTDDVRGTGQYYTSSTTVTLKPGTAAKVSVWVKTCELYHYYAENGEEKKSTPVTRESNEGGAYIGVTHTVGSTTLDQMQIKNIRSPYADEELYNSNNGWAKYTVFVRGSTFAESSFKLVLGLGQSTSSNRYEAVDGYALFDDIECTVMTSDDYEKEIGPAGITPGDENNYCTLNSKKNEKIFNTVTNKGIDKKEVTSYALDLYEGFSTLPLTESNVSAKLTTELSGPKEYTSKVDDNRFDPDVETGRKSLAGLFTYGDLLSRTVSSDTAKYNGYLANVFAKDFKDAFPFDGEEKNDEKVVLLMSTNGAAYTATLDGLGQSFTVGPKKYKLVSFFVKTNVRTGKSGASATLIDKGGNETKISSFDSTTVAKTDIDNNDDSDYNKKDIYNGWAQCFFFIENPTEESQEFTIKLHYGTTSIASSVRGDYVDGYAAFAAFETKELTAAQYGYVSTGSQAVKVSLSDTSKASSSFDTSSITSDIKTGFGTPVNFNGVVSTNIRINPDGTKENEVPAGVYTGLLNAEYAETYMNYKDGDDEDRRAWSAQLNTWAGGATTAREWWNNLFGDETLKGRVSNQPLVIVNTGDTEATSYGYYLYNTATVSADAYQKISMRVKVSAGATAYIYLNDASDVKNGYGNALTPSMAKVTYWYDDEGNICAKDPSDKSFNKKKDVLFFLETNGLYTKADDQNGGYYANLHNYDKDEYGNLVTSDNATIAYYYNDNTFYAYYDKDKKTYSQPVKNLPTTDAEGKSIVRYTAPEDAAAHGSVIKVEGSGQWVDVSFFVHAGNAAKTYRLELWAGSRDNETKIPAHSYFFFDSYSSADASSNYQTLLDEKIENVKTYYNQTKGLNPGDEGYLGDDDNLPEEYALYYTFTFYDAPWHLRYDESLDDEKEGNPYASYKQSSNSEKIISFAYDNTAGNITDSELRSYAYFLDYTAYDVTVERDSSSDSGDDDHDHDDETENDTNIWLILSSVLLVAALLAAAGTIIGRKVYRHLKKTGRISSGKKPKKQKKAPAPEIVKDEPEKKEEKPLDPNDPYNE